MAGTMTTYLRNKIYDHVFRNTAYTPPATVYIALHTADPGLNGTANELVGTSYARQAMTVGAPTAGVGSNSAEIAFGPAGSDWAAVTHVVAWDALTSGNALNGAALVTPRDATTGQVMRFLVGELDLSFT